MARFHRETKKKKQCLCQTDKGKKVKERIAVNGFPSYSYVTSLATWDHTVLPATRHKWTRPILTPASKLVLDLSTRRDGRLSWPRLPATHHWILGPHKTTGNSFAPSFTTGVNDVWRSFAGKTFAETITKLLFQKSVALQRYKSTHRHDRLRAVLC